MVANATWSDNDLLEDSNDDLEIANLCLIVEEEDRLDDDKPKVDDKPFTYDELLHAFDIVLEDSKN